MIFVLFVCILIFCVPFSCDFFLSTYNIVCNVVSLCNEVKYTILWNSSASVTADDWFEKEWEWTFWYIDLSQIILSLVYVIGSDLKKKKKVKDGIKWRKHVYYSLPSFLKCHWKFAMVISLSREASNWLFLSLGSPSHCPWNSSAIT